MKIILYKNKGELNRLDKSNYLESIIELNGTLRNATSLLTPSIQLEYQVYDYKYIVDDDSLLVVDDDSILIDYLTGETNLILEANYMYIEEFKRYYFINDIVSVHTNLWMISANVDVLMSYKDEILKQEGFISRNENDYNTLITDDFMSYELTSDISIYTPTKGDLVNKEFISDTSSTPTSNVIITTLTYLESAQDFTKKKEFIESPDECLPTINNQFNDFTTYNYPWVSSSQGLDNFAFWIIDKSSNASFLRNIIIYPFNIDTISGWSRGLVLGKEITTDFICGAPLHPSGEYLVFGDFTYLPSSNDFLAYDEKSVKYELWIPYVGYVDITANELINQRLLVIYKPNYNIGTSTVYIVNHTKHYIVYSGTCNIGVKVPYSSTNAYENQLQENAIKQQLAISLIASAVSIGVGVASGGTTAPLAIASGAMTGLKSAGSYVTSKASILPRANVNMSSANDGLYSDNKIHIKITKVNPTMVRNATYRKNFAMPLHAIRKLSNLEGLTVVSNIHLEGFENATSSELNSIESRLHEGIII